MDHPDPLDPHAPLATRTSELRTLLAGRSDEQVRDYLQRAAHYLWADDPDPITRGRCMVLWTLSRLRVLGVPLSPREQAIANSLDAMPLD